MHFSMHMLFKRRMAFGAFEGSMLVMRDFVCIPVFARRKHLAAFSAFEDVSFNIAREIEGGCGKIYFSFSFFSFQLGGRLREFDAYGHSNSWGA